MKTYSIGRDPNCDIVINDTTDVISRRHALLNVYPSGKMTIMDQSSNGTYVNGIRISQNVSVPVSRKDIVSLAHVAKLDWDRIPKSNQWMIYLGSAVAAIIVIVGIIFGIKSCNSNQNGGGESPVAEQVDSTALKQKEAARLDSIKDAARKDSLEKAKKEKKDSIKDKKQGYNSKNEKKGKTQSSDKNKKKNEQKEEGNKTRKNKPLG